MKAKIIFLLLFVTSSYSFSQVVKENQLILDSLRNIVKTEKLSPIDSIKSATEFLANVILKKTLQLLKVSYKHFDIKYDSTHPLIINLSNENVGSIAIDTSDEKFILSGYANVSWNIFFEREGPVEIGLSNNNISVKGTTPAKISSGTANFDASFQCNKIPFSIEKGSLIFYNPEGKVDYKNGTICVWGKDKYFYFERAWYKK